MNKKIGIIGFGIIGKAVWKLFKDTNLDIRIFDPNLNYDSYIDLVKNDKEVPVSTKDKNQAKKLLDECDISFVCVPTPHNQYDGLDMSIIEDVISSFSSINLTRNIETNDVFRCCYFITRCSFYI